MKNFPMSIDILYLTILFCFLVTFAGERKIYAPGCIFNLVFLGTIILYQLELSLLQQSLSDSTVLILFLCVISYNIAVILCTFFLQKKAALSRFPVSNFQESNEFRLRVARYIVLIVFFVEVVYSGGVPLVWLIQGNPKTYFNFGIPSVHGAFNGLVICMGAYYLFHGSKRKESLLYISIGFLIISRQVLMSIFVEGVVFYFLAKKNAVTMAQVKSHHFAVFFMIIFLGFGAVGNFRSGSNTMERLFYAKNEVGYLPDFIKWIYSYMTFSLNNFNNLVSMTEGGINRGASMLSSLLPTVFGSAFDLQLSFNRNFLVDINFNVSTYLPPIYLDFGLSGIVMFNVAIGILGCLLYRKTKMTNVSSYLMYTVYVQNIVFLFFVNMFIFLPIIIQWFYIPLIWGGKMKKPNSNLDLKGVKKECYARAR
ncbi:MAG: oligosaccharide repeat unit polymerase [Synergistaceae bacterium]|jgi:oligosaccharide repeat unit polymerase|nr:oligosaccharide repeat unit polymerase [Synergistaceae bacterium]